MLNKTQKNFRKQMQDYKNNKVENEEQIFSYIENRMISDYYKIESKRTYKKTIPLAAILLLIIMVGLKVYNFAPTILLNKKTDIPSKKYEYINEVSNFITDINNLRLKQSEMIALYNGYLAEYKNGNITRKDLKLKIQNLINKNSLINIEYDKIKIIEGLEKYYVLAKENASLHSSLLEIILLQQESSNIKYNKEIETIQAKINLNSDEMKKEILYKFDELGIEYKIDSNGSIKYTIKY